MNKFLESLKFVEQTYKNKGINLEFKDKIAFVVYNAIQDIETSTEKEVAMKQEYLRNINRVICNYDDFKDIIEQKFNNKDKEKLI